LFHETPWNDSFLHPKANIMAKQQSLKPMITQYHLSTTLPRYKIPVPDACRGDSGQVLTGEILEIPKYLKST
jgi:hypothetical protein